MRNVCVQLSPMPKFAVFQVNVTTFMRIPVAFCQTRCPIRRVALITVVVEMELLRVGQGTKPRA